MLPDGSPIRLFESGSIMQYLVDRYDTEHKVSYPRGSREYYEVNNWVCSLFFLFGLWGKRGEGRTGTVRGGGVKRMKRARMVLLTASSSSGRWAALGRCKGEFLGAWVSLRGNEADGSIVKQTTLPVSTTIIDGAGDCGLTPYRIRP